VEQLLTLGPISATEHRRGKKGFTMSDDSPSTRATFEIAGSDTLDVPAVRMTGRAWVDHLASGREPSRVRLVRAFFEPGARTVWHRHWRGQIIHVTDGVLIVQQRGQDAVAVGPGESSVCPPGEWHWHGAGPDRFLSHLAVIEPEDDGQDAEWGEPVSDAVYAECVARALRNG
jgi:quercetin dioxygenase-like cupin family protein